MKTPSYDAMRMARNDSSVAASLTSLGGPVGEVTPLNTGDRVFFLTIEGDYAGTVVEAWRPGDLVVFARLDCMPKQPVGYHRSLFRAFTALDLLAEAMSASQS